MDKFKALDAMFNKRYGQKIADLNRNVYKSIKNEDGLYDVPVVTLGGGGGTIIPHKTEVIDLKAPAIVKLENRKMKPFTIVYRIAIPFSEMEIALTNEAYFNYLLDAVVEKALGNYKATVGGEDKVRFGDCYITVTKPGTTNQVFTVTDDFVEMRMFGEWASEEEG